jgi:hypothetical protein
LTAENEYHIQLKKLTLLVKGQIMDDHSGQAISCVRFWNKGSLISGFRLWHGINLQHLRMTRTEENM